MGHQVETGAGAGTHVLLQVLDLHPGLDQSSNSFVTIKIIIAFVMVIMTAVAMKTVII